MWVEDDVNYVQIGIISGSAVAAKLAKFAVNHLAYGISSGRAAFV